MKNALMMKFEKEAAREWKRVTNVEGDCRHFNASVKLVSKQANRYVGVRPAHVDYWGGSTLSAF